MYLEHYSWANCMAGQYKSEMCQVAVNGDSIPSFTMANGLLFWNKY